MNGSLNVLEDFFRYRLRIGKSNLLPLCATSIQPLGKLVCNHNMKLSIASAGGKVSLIATPFKHKSRPLIVSPVTCDELQLM